MFERVKNLAGQVAALVTKLHADPRVQAEEARVKGLVGVDPTTIALAIFQIVLAFVQGGGGGGFESLVQLVLNFFKNINPPATA